MDEQPAAAAFAEKPTLIGEHALLRPFRLDEDVDVLRELLTDPEVSRFTAADPGLTPPPPWDEAAEQRMRAWYGSRADQSDRLDLAVVDRAAGRCVGEVVLNEWEPAHRSCNIRICLTAAGRDRGLGTEAMRLMAGHGFERLGLHRISLGVFSFNPRARRSYRKVGFVPEGVRRQAVWFGDHWADDELMAVLATEWEQHRGYPEGR
ncbi:GNAT family N-acetyltransferase [Kitasatospora sp. NBC_01287]|uniref:GNAT family N-acetyltransferase n=1 Tax=Kitasatospora sp. NBC_01287 TaxID=2903573 RepID=UPI002259A6B1|nr:GNAT family protein [Kitasatospora sp. NBC_01287]MCX4744597.1 GNAT family N-acetyltransferase [Kitasatospora sp. NBC_01287]